MQRSTRQRVSPALIVSIVALVLAATGTSLAAAPVAFVAKTLGLNSTQKKQVKSIAAKQIAGEASKLSVLHAKSAESATTATDATTAANATNAANALNAVTATNATNAVTATSATTAGNSADLGGVAASAYQQYGATLPSGATETGVWGGGSTAPASGDLYAFTTSFPVPLAAELGLANTIVVSGASAPGCPGVGQADPGYLCLYETGFFDHAEVVAPYNAESGGGAGGAGARGFGLTIKSTAAGTIFASGSFAVTAP
jgi:hypothetical protein